MRHVWRPLVALIFLVGLVALSFPKSAQVAHASAPTITSIAPGYGHDNETLTISGSGFGTNPNVVWVHFGSTLSSVGSLSDTQLTTSVPNALATGLVQVAVYVSGVASNTSPFYVTGNGSSGCTPNCAVNFTWTANQTVQGDCPSTNTTCATQSHTYCLYNVSSCSGLDGEVIDVTWADIEPTTQGSYTWTALDSQINDWVSVNDAQGVPFHVGIVFEYIPDGGVSDPSCSGTKAADNPDLPAYITSDASIPYYCDNSQSIGTYYYPDYCSSDFTTYLDDAMAALAEHIAKQSYVGQVSYIQAGLGVGHESFEFRGMNTSTTEPTTPWNNTMEEPAFEWAEDTASPSCINDHATLTTTWSAWQRARATNWANYLSFTKVGFGLNSQFYGSGTSAQQVVDEEYFATQLNFASDGYGNLLNHGRFSTNLSPNYTYAGINSVDQYITNFTDNIPSSGGKGQYWRGYETDTSVDGNTGTGFNMDQYAQTAYCDGGGYTNAGNTEGVTVNWYANIPSENGAGTVMQNLHAYVNGTTLPVDDTYCSGQNGYYNNP